MALSEWGPHILIPGAAILGVVFAISLWIKVSKIQVGGQSNDDGREYLLEEQRDDAEARFFWISCHMLDIAFDV